MLEEIYNNKNKALDDAARDKLSAYKLKTVLAHLNMSTFEYDIEKDVLYVYKEDVRLHDFTDHWFTDGGKFYYLENVTEKLHEMVRESFVEMASKELDKIKHNTSGELLTFDTPLVYKKGNTRWTNFIADTMLDEDGRPLYVIGYCKDINEQKKELYRVYNVARTDALTGMRNRTTGIYKIESGIREDVGEQHFLAVLDLNKFKQANDLFGHAFGDVILKSVSERIQQFSDHYTISSRTGGDEFMVFRKCDDEEDAMRLLTELKNKIRHSQSVGDLEFHVEASIGFAMHPAQGTGFDELYNKADIAMYHAKRNNTDGPVLYDAAMASVRT